MRHHGAKHVEFIDRMAVVGDVLTEGSLQCIFCVEASDVAADQQPVLHRSDDAHARSQIGGNKSPDRRCQIRLLPNRSASEASRVRTLAMNGVPGLDATQCRNTLRPRIALMFKTAERT